MFRNLSLHVSFVIFDFFLAAATAVTALQVDDSMLLVDVMLAQLSVLRANKIRNSGEGGKFVNLSEKAKPGDVITVSIEAIETSKRRGAEGKDFVYTVTLYFFARYTPNGYSGCKVDIHSTPTVSRTPLGASNYLWWSALIRLFVACVVVWSVAVLFRFDHLHSQADFPAIERH